MLQLASLFTAWGATLITHGVIQAISALLVVAVICTMVYSAYGKTV